MEPPTGWSADTAWGDGWSAVAREGVVPDPSPQPGAGAWGAIEDLDQQSMRGFPEHAGSPRAPVARRQPSQGPAEAPRAVRVRPPAPEVLAGAAALELRVIAGRGPARMQGLFRVLPDGRCEVWTAQGVATPQEYAASGGCVPALTRQASVRALILCGRAPLARAPREAGGDALLHKPHYLAQAGRAPMEGNHPGRAHGRPHHRLAARARPAAAQRRGAAWLGGARRAARGWLS